MVVCTLVNKKKLRLSKCKNYISWYYCKSLLNYRISKVMGVHELAQLAKRYVHSYGILKQ
jgi:hypothetical protein